MRFKKYTILTILFLFLMSMGVMAAGKYTDDGAGILKPATVDTINTNFQKVEQNSGAVVKMVTIKSLNKQDIKSYAQNYAKQNFSTNKYVLFLVAPNDGKTQFIVGPGLNAVFSSADIDKISHLSDNDFKSKKFDDGFTKVGQAIDQKITSTAVKTGDAVVQSNGYSNTVKPAIPWGKYFLIFLIIVIIAVIVIMVFKRLVDKDYEKRKKKFAEDNNLNDYNSDNSSFKSASVNSGLGSTTSSYTPPVDTSFNTTSVHHNEPYGTTHDSYTETIHHSEPVHRTNPSHSTHTTINNTTVVNNNNRSSGYGYGNSGSGFVEGMLVGEALEELSHDHHHNHHDYYEHDNDYHHNDYDRHKPEPEVTSGDWNNSGTSDWGSSNSDSGSSSWGSPTKEESSWSDSSSSYDSGSSWDSSSSDSGSSDW